MNNIEMAGPEVLEEDIKYVIDALQNGWYGKHAYTYVEKFEKEFSAYHDRAFALMTPNCTSAIHLLLKGLDIKNEDEVIAPDCTWIGSVAGITHQRAQTILADFDPENWCLSPETIMPKLTKNTKAIIVVNLYGNMPEYDRLVDFCSSNDIFLIEDAAESLGSSYKGIKSGKFGIGSVFSFHRTKTITTGEGGMLLLDDEDLYERCKFLRDHGRKPGSFYVEEVAQKYMPFNVQAALGYAQFKRIDQLVGKKINILHRFKDNLKDFDNKITMNPEPPHIINGAWAPALVFDQSLNLSKEAAMDFLTKRSLPVRPFFYPLSSTPAFDIPASNSITNPHSYDVSSRAINLPSALNLTFDQIDQYSEAISDLLLQT
jgi:perosamine synthetase